MQLSVIDGATETVTLRSRDDPARLAADFASRHGLAPEEAFALQAALAEEWQKANAKEAPTYDGPTCQNNALQNCIASSELSGLGLVLDVADSVVAQGERGLFVRCRDGLKSVTVDAGTPMCSYTGGRMRAEPSESGKDVLFALFALHTLVWFEDQLRTVGDLLDDDSIDGFAGHVVIRDENSGALVGIKPDVMYSGPRTFVPDSIDPTLFDTTGAFAQMANDLAIGGHDSRIRLDGSIVDSTDAGISETDNSMYDVTQDALYSTAHSNEKALYEQQEARALYEKESRASNLLVLWMCVERDKQQPRQLIPVHPISTLSRTIRFANHVPMEIGCHYGWPYWKRAKLGFTKQSP